MRRIILAAFFTQTLACAIAIVLFIWVWSVGGSFWVTAIGVLILSIMYFGYVIVGYAVNNGQGSGVAPIVSIYALGVTLMLLMLISALSSTHVLESWLAIANLPSIYLIELVDVFSFLREWKGGKVVYVISGLFPSVLIHLGYILKGHRLKKHENDGCQLEGCT